MRAITTKPVHFEIFVYARTSDKKRGKMKAMIDLRNKWQKRINVAA